MTMFPLQLSQNICGLIPPAGFPPALDNIDDMVGIMLFSAARINLGINFITASTAAVFDSFSFAFVAYTDTNRNYFLRGVSTFLFQIFNPSGTHTLFLTLV